MPLRGSGYRWVARRRMMVRQKREHKHKAIQDLHELRHRISGGQATPEHRKKAIAEVRAQAKSRLMEPGQHLKESHSPQTASHGVFHEVVHDFGPSDPPAARKSRLRKLRKIRH